MRAALPFLLLVACTADEPGATADAGAADASIDAESPADAATSDTSADPRCGADGGYADCNGNAADGCELLVRGSDGKNCGACAHDCLGATCTSGLCAPITLAQNQSEPFGVATSGTDVFFTTGDGAVKRAPLAGGGGAPTVIASGLGTPRAIAADSTSLYVALEGDGSATGGSIAKLGHAPSTPTTIASSRNRPRAMVLDGTTIFFVEAGSLTDGAISRVDTNGTGAATLASALEKPTGIAVDATDVFFTTKTGVSRMKKDGSGKTQIAAASGAKGIAVDASYVWFTTDLRVQRMGKDGSNVTVVANTKAPVAVLLDGTRLYVTEFDRLLKAETSPVCATSTQLLASAQLSGIVDDVSSLALDPTGAYLVYATPYGSTVMKVAK